MPQHRRSTVIAAMLDVADRLEHATWPLHPTTNRAPKVGKANETIVAADEWVDVICRNEDNTVEWVLVGAGAPGRRDERYWVDIAISSTVPGKSRVVALERIGALKDVVEDLFHDPNTGALLHVGGDADWAVNLGGVREVMADAYRTDQGWHATCVVSVAVAARI